MPRSGLVLLLAIATGIAGCGGGGDSTTSTGSAGNRYFGEHRGQEETTMHISAADCAALAVTVGRQTETALRRASDPTPPNSHCQLQGPGVHVSVSLDTAHAARTRYSNRIDEQVQFNAADPAKVPHPVPAVGDKGAYNQNATWIPAYSTLWAVRGNRWLTVVYSAAGRTRPQRLAVAAPLARQAFRLTARQRAGSRPSASPARR
jgi:hypothetical protein